MSSAVSHGNFRVTIHLSKTLRTCFENVFLQANPDNYHLPLCSKTPIEASFGGTSVRSINTKTNVFFSFTESIALFKKLFGTRLTVTVRLQS